MQSKIPCRKCFPNYSTRYHSFMYVAVYVLFVWTGRKFMRNRQPLKMRQALIAWNAALAVFSVLGAIRIFPEFLASLKAGGFRTSYCRISDGYYEGVNGFWVYAFHASKVLEFGDTVFLVLRKRPVLFLHWYHHATVVLYSWLTYPWNNSPLRWMVVMNFSVHAVMYAYFASRAWGAKCPRFLAPAITAMQIGQFVMGTWVLFDSYMNPCDINQWVALASFALYLSYFTLFAQFFYGSYVKNVGKQRVE